MNAQWDQIRKHLQTTLEPGIFKVWISPLKGQVADGVLTLLASSSFVADWISERLAPTISSAAESVLGHSVTLRISVNPERKRSTRPVRATERSATAKTGNASSRADTARNSSSVQKNRAVAEQLSFSIPMPARRAPVWRYDFESFVVGPCNGMAYAAAKSLVSDCGSVNTLFLSAGPGLGKTHLAQAVGKALCAACNISAPRIEYLTAENFASIFVQAAKAHDFSAFKWRFHEADVLLLEDIHFLQNTDRIQIELLSAIKALQERGKRVVLTSSFSPRELKNVDSGLVSRFTSGFLADIVKPDRATRRCILLDKARQHGLALPDEVCELLAEHLAGDIRQLESCLQNLLLRSQILNTIVTRDMALEVLSQYAIQTPFFNLDSITQQVCEAFGLCIDQLATRSRKANLVLARNTIFYLARKHTDLSLEAIGGRFNRRHSTVIKGIASVERELSRETSIGRQISDTLDRIEKRKK